MIAHVRIPALAAMTIGVGAILLRHVHQPGYDGDAGLAFWVAVSAFWLLATLLAREIAAATPASRLARRAASLGVPLVFGVMVVVLWELMVVGAGVPSVLLPPPSAIAVSFVASLPMLGEDFVQTFLKGALTGFVAGSLAGFLCAILAARSPFLRRGLLPIGNLTAALPIVGIAPIMVMWFGFDWPSKAAVVALMTFFPMLVNTDAGLRAAGHLEQDMMRTYASGRVSTLWRLELPAALPFVFTGLKINATLALIGAIVAEFFGTPIVGMGFRISIEASRMALDVVWAEVALAAFAGSAFYGILVVIERAATHWHPSVRST